MQSYHKLVVLGLSWQHDNVIPVQALCVFLLCHPQLLPFMLSPRGPKVAAAVPVTSTTFSDSSRTVF